MEDDDIDDFDATDFESDSGFDDYTAQGTLGDLWRNNPMVKVGVILAAFALIVGGIVVFGGKKEKPLVSHVIRGDNATSQAPGSAEVSETYRKAIEQENVRRVEEALRKSESAVPMPVEPPKGTLPLQFDEPEEEDPLERWRRMQKERVKQQKVISSRKPEEPPDAPPPVEEPIVEEVIDTRTPAVNELAEAMTMQMTSILQNQEIPRVTSRKITPASYVEDVIMAHADSGGGGDSDGEDEASGGSGDGDVKKILIPAATIEYAQLITEANTDAPGYVLAYLASGPYRGSKLIGKFSATHNYLVLSFKTMVMNGQSYSIDAVAIDPDTTLPGVVTDIDRRYLMRFVLPTAASFIKGFSKAIAETASTVDVVGDTVVVSEAEKTRKEEIAAGLEEAGDTIAGLIEEEASQVKPMLKIRAGTPIGVLFVKEVTEDDNSSAKKKKKEDDEEEDSSEE